MKTRESRTKGTQIQYKSDETTIIKNLKTSKYHIKPKQDLTDYLNKTLKIAITEANIPYVICNKNQCLTNVGNFDQILREQNHEETNTIVIFHSFDLI